jgi:hypothetical protein
LVQKQGGDAFIRQVDAIRRLFSVISQNVRLKIERVSALTEKGGVMSQFRVWARMCVGKSAIDSSAQAQETGNFMGQKWRLIDSYATLLIKNVIY